MKKAHEREQNDELDVSSGDDVKVNVESSAPLPPPGPTAGSNPKPTPLRPPSPSVAHVAAGQG